MSDQSIFSTEEETIQSFAELLEKTGTADSSYGPLSNLLNQYKKLYRQFRRLVRLSDMRQKMMDEKNAEINSLLTEITAKNTELEVISKKLSRYLSPQVYDSIFLGKQEAAIHSTRKKLTVFFSDIVGFTEITDTMAPEDMTFLLNDYLNRMSGIALKHGGTIDKFIGDAIMIFFGDPESKGIQQDAIDCVTMALEMREAVQEIQERWDKLGVSWRLKVRTGIATGYCTVGNFGNEHRMDYTIVGGSVNVASRLEHIAEPAWILIPHETYSFIKDTIHCEIGDEVQVKGVGHPIQTYRVVDLYTNLAKAGHAYRKEGEGYSFAIDFSEIPEGTYPELVASLKGVLKQIRNIDPSAI